MRHRKTTPRIFLLPNISQLSISYTFQVSSHREVFLESCCLWISVNFYNFFFFWKISVELFAAIVFLLFATSINIKVCHMYLKTLWTQWSNTCYFEEQIFITSSSIASVRSESLSGFLKKVKLVDIDLQYKFFWKNLIIKCFKYNQPKNWRELILKAQYEKTQNLWKLIHTKKNSSEN